MAGSCFVCGNPVAPFGFGWPGFHSEKPKGKRGYVWTCSEHREVGEKRQQNAIAASYGRLIPFPELTPTTETKGTTK